MVIPIIVNKANINKKQSILRIKSSLEFMKEMFFGILSRVCPFGKSNFKNILSGTSFVIVFGEDELSIIFRNLPVTLFL